MAKIWKEKYDWRLHHNRMAEQFPSKIDSRGKVQTAWVYFVRVCSFTFEFHSKEQIRTCLDYYSSKVRPSSRMSIGAADHWEAQRWFEHLPMYLLEEPKRLKVVKALVSAIEFFDREDITK